MTSENDSEQILSLKDKKALVNHSKITQKDKVYNLKGEVFFKCPESRRPICSFGLI